MKNRSDLVLKGIAIRDRLKKTLDAQKNRLQEVEKEILLYGDASRFLQEVAIKTQSGLKFQVEGIVNTALDACFPNEYEFSIDFESCRGRTEARMFFIDKRTFCKVEPMFASGGGVVDVASFALRIACHILEKGASNVIILDEPFRFLSRDLQGKAGEILRLLSERLRLQIILVTHIPELIDCASKVFKCKKIDGVSSVQVD